jgi:S-adenosylmethionine decarboxylase
LSIHTWPEHNYISIDIFTCGNSNTQEIANELKKYFNTNKFSEKVVYRGKEIENQKSFIKEKIMIMNL